MNVLLLCDDTWQAVQKRHPLGGEGAMIRIKKKGSVSTADPFDFWGFAFHQAWSFLRP